MNSGRWGGEEFILILVNISHDKLYGIANRLRLLVEQSSISRAPDDIQVTISVGATLVQQDDTLDTLVKRADQLMYQSKASGRNCVSMNRDIRN